MSTLGQNQAAPQRNSRPRFALRRLRTGSSKGLGAAIFEWVSAGRSGATLLETIAVAIHLEDVGGVAMNEQRTPVGRSDPVFARIRRRKDC